MRRIGWRYGREISELVLVVVHVIIPFARNALRAKILRGHIRCSETRLIQPGNSSATRGCSRFFETNLHSHVGMFAKHKSHGREHVE